MNTPREILYRPRGRFRSNHLGPHASTEVGGFGVFRDQAPFLRYPDARRIDIRASLRDPFEQVHVRRFEQRQSIDVVAIVDLSASMGVRGACDKFALACRVAELLAYSATKIGDRFGLIACDEAVRKHALLLPTRSRGLALRSAWRLQEERPDGKSAEGLLAAAEALGATRKLVFLISDFRWQQRLLERVFDAFALHDATPLVILDSAEEAPPSWGLLELIDSESGARKLWAMRPGLRARWIEQEKGRQAFLTRLAAHHCRAPIFIRDSFDTDILSLQLMAA